MYSKINKILSVFLAIIVLLSTFSFTVEKHYCGDFLIDVSFIGQTSSCGMQMNEGSSEMKKKCCKDEISKIQGQDELKKDSAENFTLKKEKSLVSFSNFYSIPLYSYDDKIDFYKDFSPPDIPVNFQTYYQVYLI